MNNIIRKEPDRWMRKKGPAYAPKRAGFTTNEMDRTSVHQHEWFKNVELVRKSSLSSEEWFVEKLHQGTLMLRACIDIDPGIRSGIPVIKDTRIPVSRILAELADGLTLPQIADDLELDQNLLKILLDGMASCIGLPFRR